MPLPATRTVTGSYTNPVTGLPATGTVIFTPFPLVWTDTDGNQILAGGATITLTDGTFSQPLVPTDTPGVFPTGGKLWRIETRLTGLPYLPEYFELASGASSIDITDLVEVDPEPPPFLPEGTAGGDLTGSYPSPQLRNTQTARDNLGLGSSATRDVGVAFGQVADGEPNALSTGLIAGGALSVSVTPQAVDVAALTGYVVDYSTDPMAPTVVRVNEAAQTVLLDAAALLRTLTWWLVDDAGAFVQQATTPTNVQRRTHLVLGFSILFAGAVVFTKSVPQINPQPMNQLADLMDALGPFSVAGNTISANGANLMINQSGGTMFSRGFSHALAPDNPHIAPTAAQSPAQFRMATQSTTVFPDPVTVLDVANFDLGGVITPVGGGSNQSTLMRVFLFAQDNAADQLAIQYGQTTHTSLAAAQAAVSTGGFIINPAFVGTLLGWIAVTRTATNLSDPAQAVFIRAGKFATP